MNDPQQRKDFLSPHAGNRIEKLKSIGLPIPDKIKDVLEQLHDRSEREN